MTLLEIQNQLDQYASSGKKIFVSSSFQTHSIPLLHLLSTSKVKIDFIFIDTGYHFPETLSFRDKIAALLGINIINATPSPDSQQKDAKGQFYYVSDPDHCCYINKTKPLESYLKQYDVWISGVRADQTATRKNMKTEQSAPFDTIRFHPMLDWDTKKIIAYRNQFQLPEHPLEKQGYQSIGCAPCTKKVDISDKRSARWSGTNKTECGLHTDLLNEE